MVWPFNKPQEVVFVPTVPVMVTPPSRLRLGMWVNASGRIGIITDFKPADMVVITYTRADGSTLIKLSPEDVAIPDTGEYPSVQVQQATISEIPRARYESVEQLHALGYKD